MPHNHRQHQIVLLFLLLYGLLLFVLAFTLDGTGDDGDSVLHYLCSRYAPQHPWLFFDHWAKPFFVLLTAPFAQFGFVGMKIFNSLCTCFALYFTYRTAVELKLPQAYLAPVFGALMPLYFVLSLSGLLEPLTALMLILAVFLELKDKSLAAAILISFLPFVRYEGLIIMGVWAIFYGLSGKWKFIPLLFIGHLIYSIAGYPIYGNLLWVFTGNSNATFWAYQDGGNWDHFIVSLIYVIGVPLYALWWLGLLHELWIWLQPKRRTAPTVFRHELWLVYGAMTAFLAAHTIFYGLGIFKTLGMLRVLLSIAPLLAIVCLKGWLLLFQYLPKGWWQTAAQAVFLFYILIFPCTKNPAAINWERDLHLHPTQILLKDVTAFLQSTYPNRCYYYTPSYISILLDLDHFDREKNRRFIEIFQADVPPGAIAIWDDWFNVQDDSITLEEVEQLPDWRKVQSFETLDRSRLVQYVVFEYIGTK